MKTNLVAAILAASMFAAPAAIVTSTPSLAATCGVDAPAEWERPGGYCDQLRSTESLSDRSDAPEVSCADAWQYLKNLPIGDSVLVAADCNV